MFTSLLIALFSVAIVLTSLVVTSFRRPIEGILNRLVGESMSAAWVKFLSFALYVVGISSAVHSYRLDKYVSKQHTDAVLTDLNLNTWILEVYETVRSVLGGLAWSLMSFFTVALIAVIIVRSCELKKEKN